VSVEIYRKPSGRFITVTGKRFGDAPDVLADLDALADTVKAELEALKAERKAKQKKEKPEGGGGEKKDLPPLDDIIKNGHFEHWGGDRSRAEYYVVHQLIRLGKSDEEIIAIFSNADNAIAAHCLSKPENPRDYIMRTIAKARGVADPVDPDGAEIARLAALSDIVYERERIEAAERLGFRASMLDHLVQAERDRKKRASGGDDGKLQGKAVKLEEPKPWDEAVASGAELLDAIVAIIKEYVIFDNEHAPRVVALWIVFTYLVHVFQFSPRLCITSPTKGCGKTTLLDIIFYMVLRPLLTSNVSAAALFRVIEKYMPCAMIDEGDTFINLQEELRGVLNSGHRRGGGVLRVVGDDLEPRLFATFCACVIALIGLPPPTVTDRSVVIELKRKRPGEKVRSFRTDRVEPFKTLGRKAARWAQDHAIEIGATEAELPPEIFNRAADNWRVLKQIALVAGGSWPDYVDAAARAATADFSDEELLVQLLADIQAIEFAYEVHDHENGKEIVRTYEREISSAVLVQKLIELQGRPWAELPDTGKALTANKLARMVKPLGIAPDFLGPEDARARGYRREHFEEAFDRYLSERGEEGVSKRASVQDSIKQGVSDDFKPCSPETGCTVEKCEKPYNGSILHGCTVAKGESGQTAQQAAQRHPSFRVIGPEPDSTPCEQCGANGEVYLIRHPSKVESHALHQECARFFYRCDHA
jgi:Protein of unknown function (DUF3631)